MKFTNQQYAQSLHEAITDTNPKDHDVIINNFIEILKSHGKLGEYEKIIAEYENYDLKQRGVQEIEITTTGQATVSKSMLDDLNKIIGNDTVVKQRIDQNIIGGVVIRAGDTLIDGSIKNQLNQLKDNLTQ